AETRRMAAEAGRLPAGRQAPIQVWTPIGVVCRPTQREAEEITGYVISQADLGAVGHLADLHAADGRDRPAVDSAFVNAGEGPRERQVLARGNFCAIGDPDRVAAQVARLAAVGFDGLVLNFVNYLDEFPFFAQEVLPRLEAMGLREGGKN